MAEGLPQSFVDASRQRLSTEWETIQQLPKDARIEPHIPDEISDAIKRSINSKTKTYRYVLPTQLLAKLVDVELDARCIQVGSGLQKAFDARSLCHGIIVEFDQANHLVLGGSAEPYLNNPLRIPAVLPSEVRAQRNKSGFQDLIKVLDYAQQHPGEIGALFKAVLVSIRSRLATVAVSYPVPNRVSLKQTISILEEFLSEKTGGLRLQVVAVALFRVIGKQFHLYAGITSANINAADAATGSAADIECLDQSGKPIMAIEVKDRRLRLHDIQSKLPVVREKGVRELLFLVHGGVQRGNDAAVMELVDRQFVTGQNVYVVEFRPFLESCLMLFGEVGRREYLREVGSELDIRRADIQHRRNWVEMLETL